MRQPAERDISETPGRRRSVRTGGTRARETTGSVAATCTTDTARRSTAPHPTGTSEHDTGISKRFDSRVAGTGPSALPGQVNRHQHERAVDLREPVRRLLGHEYEIARSDLPWCAALDSCSARIVGVRAPFALERAARDNGAGPFDHIEEFRVLVVSGCRRAQAADAVLEVRVVRRKRHDRLREIRLVGFPFRLRPGDHRLHVRRRGKQPGCCGPPALSPGGWRARKDTQEHYRRYRQSQSHGFPSTRRL